MYEDFLQLVQYVKQLQTNSNKLITEKKRQESKILPAVIGENVVQPTAIQGCCDMDVIGHDDSVPPAINSPYTPKTPKTQFTPKTPMTPASNLPTPVPFVDVE